ncbi:unnamed protein product [Strongylus vulgaris]|uniref:Uncharacterized protein n=1 Tax=Strongylus vulgaris TaxID=40348 RepID=A0A3P7JAF6_STRVU|nr:unnamed protein product [Strongylus vulgaris]
MLKESILLYNSEVRLPHMIPTFAFSPILEERMVSEWKRRGELRVGLRSGSGALLLINLGTHFCDLMVRNEERSAIE